MKNILSTISSVLNLSIATTQKSQDTSIQLMDAVKYWRSEALKYREDSIKESEKMPFIQFIWGDVETGWVFGASVDEYPEIKIGMEVEFGTNPKDFKEKKVFIVERFGEFNNRFFSFYLTLKP